MALNGGPTFKFNQAISFLIHCQSQEEVDRYWEQLGASRRSSAHMKVIRRRL